MSKRLTDTEKWRDEWYGSLPNDYRIVWMYLVDTCNHAGIWKKDFRGLNFNCNVSLTEENVKEIFNGRLVDCGGFFFIPKFLKFQYPQGLNSQKPVILSVVKELQLNNLTDIVTQLLGNDYLIIKSKSKSNNKDIDKDKSNEKEKSKSNEKEKAADSEKGVIAQCVIKHLNEVADRNYQTTNQLYLRRIIQRLKEGYTEQDLREIIEIKAVEWKGSEFEKFLQPDTLFSERNCNKYRDQVRDAKEKRLSISQIRGEKKTGNANLMAEVQESLRRKFQTQ